MAVADIYTLLMGDSLDSQETAQALADRLRFKKGAALIGAQAAGPPGVAKFMQDQGQAEEKELYGGLERRMQYGQERQAHIERLQQAKQQHEDSLKAQERALKLTLGNIPNWEIEGNFMWNKKTGEMMPLPEGFASNMALKATAKGTKPLSLGEVKALSEINEELATLKDTASGFKDEYAGGLVQDAKTVLAQRLGGTAFKAWQPSAEFWARYQMLLEIPQRRRMFGTALSANEKALWERAKTLTPRSDPNVIKNTFREMTNVYERKIGDWKKSRVAAGYNQEELDPLTSSLETPLTIGSTKKTAGAGDVTVIWKGKAKVIPAARLDEALKAGATKAP
jgi:HPt (histidine-containing phosphotransfer) domain-containing protein